MGINEKIQMENDRHNKRINELNDILNVYYNNSRENSIYIENNINQAIENGYNVEQILQYEESRRRINPYAKQIQELEQEKAQENNLYQNNISALMAEKREKEQQDSLIQEETHQKEIETNNLKQAIEQKEKEILDIKASLFSLSNGTLGSYYSDLIFEKYPEEYNTFNRVREQVTNYSSSVNQIFDLKQKLSIITEDLEFYKAALLIYQSYRQRFEEMKKAEEEKNIIEREQEKIYNLIYSEINEKLKKQGSLYTAWDLGDKIIPSLYQGMTYEQVENLISQQKKIRKEQQDSKKLKEELIIKAIKKDFGMSEDEYLSDIRIENCRKKFEYYTNEMLVEYINGSKKLESQNLHESTKPLDFSLIVKEVEIKNNLINQIIEKMESYEIYYPNTVELRYLLNKKTKEELEIILNDIKKPIEEDHKKGKH